MLKLLDFLQKYKALANRICSLLGQEADRLLRNLCTAYNLPSGSSASKIIKQIRSKFFKKSITMHNWWRFCDHLVATSGCIFSCCYLLFFYLCLFFGYSILSLSLFHVFFLLLYWSTANKVEYTSTTASVFHSRLKTYLFHKSYPRSFTSSSRTASTDYCVDRFSLSTRFLFVVFPYFFVSGPCARLSWPSRQLLNAR